MRPRRGRERNRAREKSHKTRESKISASAKNTPTRKRNRLSRTQREINTCFAWSKSVGSKSEVLHVTNKSINQ